MDLDKRSQHTSTASEHADMGDGASRAPEDETKRDRNKYHVPSSPKPHAADFMAPVPVPTPIVRLEPEMIAVIKNLDEQVGEARAVLAKYEAMFNAQLRICARAMGLDPDLQIFDRASASFSPVNTTGLNGSAPRPGQ